MSDSIKHQAEVKTPTAFTWPTKPPARHVGTSGGHSRTRLTPRRSPPGTCWSEGSSNDTARRFPAG